MNVAAILMGSVVRATGSGAGCGRSWPTCRGEVVPDLGGATAIEFAHRILSGLAVVSVILLAMAVWRTVPKGEPARVGAALSVAAVVVESLIGAMIVLAEWVADDASLARVVAVPLHLVNTLFLLSVLTLTVFWLRGGDRLGRPDRVGWRLLVLAGGLVLVAASGAVTALADTLFPKPSLLGGGGVERVENFLTALRAVHPFVAATLALFVLGEARRFANRASSVVIWGTVAALGLGALNVLTGTPLGLSVLHLLVADVVWVGWTWLVASHLARRPAGIVRPGWLLSDLPYPDGD